jgi:iron complex outermembrane receptor protein
MEMKVQIWARACRGLLCATAVGALVAGVPAKAQEAAPNAPASTDSNPAEPQQADAENEVGEIIVTAQFRNQNLQDTPLAITAVSAAMLDARSQTSIADIANQAPSVTLKSQGPSFGPALGANIRGVGQFDYNPALEPGVGLYVDDVYYATLTGSILDLLDLDRVEILRGPQGTLAGKNSIGGAIKLYSQKPTGSGDAYVSATYGANNRLDLRGSADFALTHNLFARVSGVAKKQDGYVDRLDFACVNPPGSALNPAVGGIDQQMSKSRGCLVDREGAINYQAVRGQLRFDNGGPIELNLIADYTNDTRSNAGAVLTFADDLNPTIRGNAFNVPYDSRFICGKFCNYVTYQGPAGVWNGAVAPGYPLVATNEDRPTVYKGWGVSGTVDWKLSDTLSLKSITAYRSYETTFTGDDDLSPLPSNISFYRMKFWSVSQELRLNGSIADDFVQYTLGGFYQDQRSTFLTWQDLRYAPVPLQFAGNDPINADTKALFAQVSLNLNDQLTATGGIRYTKEHKDYTFSRLNRDGSPNPFIGELDGEVGVYDGDKVDYRIGLQYRINPEVMVYGQVSTGFKGGGVNPRPFNKPQVQPFGPETLTSYELGLKSDLFGRLARLNVAAFYSNYNDIQLTLLSCPQFSPGPCVLPANAGDAHIKGAEAELSLRPITGLSIDAALSYVDFEYTSINPLAGGPGNPTGAQYGNFPPYTPRWKWSIGAQYIVDLGGSGSLTPRIDAAYQGDMYSGAANTALERIPAYTLVNGRLTWKNSKDDLEISAEVTNIFNKYYFLTTLDLTGAGIGNASAQPGRPRQWAVTVKKSF